MAKCVRLYSDRELELAKSESGDWFYREYTFNSYFRCYSWTNWTALGQLKSCFRHSYVWENTNGNELNSHMLEYIFKGGSFLFKLRDKRSTKGLRYRLPY